MTPRQLSRMRKRYLEVSDVVITALQVHAGNHLGKLPHRAAFEEEADFVLTSLHQAGWKVTRLPKGNAR